MRRPRPVGRRLLAPALLACVLLAGCSASGAETTPTPADPTEPVSASANPAEADAVLEVVRDGMRTGHLRSAIVRVTRDGHEVVTAAFGESMTGVPASVDMHFRNGAVAISYVATALLQLVDDGTVSLDDTVSTWLPDFPHADRVTLGDLAQMTSGYQDYVQQPEFLDALQAAPFRQWDPEQLLAYVTSKPLFYPPGTNWNYSHTNYVILGLALEKITGQPMETLLQDKVLGPLGLDDTAAPGTAAIPEPVLHAFTSERREYFDIPPAMPFYEESTFWNPSWTITRGAVQTTDIQDMTATAVAVGEGTLLSAESHAAQVSTALRGFGSTLDGCATCFPQSEGYSYGIGVVTTGNWTLQNPMFSGAAAAEGYLASQKLAVAVAVTFAPEAFDSTGGYRNEADVLWRMIGARLAPNDAPPIKK
ncbi:serine hydrolase domain-containing protein [Nakamurella sp. GG22]